MRIPLAATGITVNKRGEPAPSFYAVCVRNMFEEERGGNPGMLDITVAPANSSAFDKAVSVFRGSLPELSRLRGALLVLGASRFSTYVVRTP